ncbi:MAG: hypothetical protein JNK84_10895 [Phreatobacter sp.]|uniref:hypothetical protein n=1 Tax=Phreatobacter sp. TaxID=1966341 RepID=UPI001A492BD5|nr:hypothetical protein [Phreatobacter sp.]MBL8569576.1 hypothetical protein [Phreatobacter sp.]
MLLRVGELTTPVLTVRSGVARLWPLLRYLHAVADTPHLKLRTAWKDVDAHQTAIASDDFGVGLGMSVLYSAFDYIGCVDGRAFLHRMHNLGLLESPGEPPPKAGSMKMADFAAIDARGKGLPESPQLLGLSQGSGRRMSSPAPAVLTRCC